MFIHEYTITYYFYMNMRQGLGKHNITLVQHKGLYYSEIADTKAVACFCLVFVYHGIKMVVIEPRLPSHSKTLSSVLRKRTTSSDWAGYTLCQ